MMPKAFEPNVQFELLDEFLNLDTSKWQSIDDGATGTNTANDVRGGQVSIVTAGADNDYHVMASAKKVFQFAAGKPMWFELECSLTEAATNAANIVLGLSSITTNGILANNGAGLPASFDGALFYKVDGGSSWNFGVSAGSAQQLITSFAPFVSGTTYRLGFHWGPGNQGNGRITPWIQSIDTNGVPTDVIDRSRFKNSQDGTYNLPYASLGLMFGVYGVKAGSTSAETLKVNRIRIIGTR